MPNGSAMAFFRSLGKKSFSALASISPNTATRRRLRLPFSRALTNNGQTAAIINGKLVAKEMKSKIACEICRMKSSIGKCPGLAVVLVGQREDSQSFIRLKLRACNEVGISSFVEQLPQDCTEDQVANVVSNLNENPDVHGILVQLPLPQVGQVELQRVMIVVKLPDSNVWYIQHLDEEKIVEFVSPEKEVDGFHPLNIGNLAMGRDPLFIPCAPKACVELLLRRGVEITGKRVAVVGRSRITGLPTSLLLQRHFATVSTLDAFTKNPEQITCQADIVISDVGIPNLIRGHWLKQGAVVIDMGANSVKDPISPHGFHITGDVCYEEAIKVASAITPVPGGVGPVTISMLLSSILDAAKRAFRFT